MNVEELKAELEEWPNDLEIRIEINNGEAVLLNGIDYYATVDGEKFLILHDYPVKK